MKQREEEQMKRFIVIEGLDGAGKSTQIKLLNQVLTERQIAHQYLHFPQTDQIAESPVFGEMVANFLKGEYGQVNEVNPYLVALLYAGDRHNAKAKINHWLAQQQMVILDRYVYSNIAFQGAKCQTLAEKHKLKQWIFNLEYQYYQIPQPTLALFLHMNFQFIQQRLQETRQGAERNYLSGKVDIHESSLELQQQVEKEYLRLVEEDDSFYKIDCFDGKGETLPPQEIHRKILDLLLAKGVLPQ